MAVPASSSFAASIDEVRHSVYLYDSDDRLSESVASYLAEGLEVGEPAVVIATPLHREGVARCLRARGIDLDRHLADGHATFLDAEETLAKFMVDGHPSWEPFLGCIGGVLGRVPRPPSRRVRAYGEMVDVLVRAGNPDGALMLEEMWCRIAHVETFDLLCAYQGSQLRDGNLARVCEVHDHAAMLDGQHALVDAITRRKSVELELRAALADLRRSEELARRRAERMTMLQQGTARLAATHELDAVISTVLDVGIDLFEAAAIAVYLFDRDGQLRLHGTRGTSQLVSRHATLSLDTPLPLTDAVRWRAPIWLGTYEQALAQYPLIGEAGSSTTSHLQSMAAVPLLNDELTVGGLAISFDAARAFDVFDRECIEGLAQQVALAIERARLYAAEHQARTEAQLLLEIAESLNEPGLELDDLLARVTNTASQLTGARHGAFSADYQSVDTLRIADLTRAAGAYVVPFDEDVASYLAVPIRTEHGEVLGSLLFGHPARGHFTEQHERLVSALAASASIALQNAGRIAELRKAGEEQRQLVEDLTETLHLNELFTGVLAHDLRNPLGAVTTAAQLLVMRAEGNATAAKPAQRILSSSRRMARMIDQLLDFTRVRIGSGLPIDSKACDLKDVIAQVVDELVETAPTRTIDVELVGDSRGSFDDDRLAQVFSNLVANAMQHGAPEQPVTVRVDGSDPEQLVAEIHNHGAIPPEVLPRLFAPMIGGERRRDGSRGLGLGLFISHEITRRHGGTLTVESTPELGTRFRLAIPRHVRVDAVADLSPLTRRNTAMSRERFLVDTIRDYAIFLLDTEGRVQSWNRGAELAKGYRADEILGKHISQFYTPEDRQRGAAHLLLRRALEDGHAEDEAWRVRKDGTRFWANVVLTALRDEHGVHTGYAKVTRDLTERKKLEEERLRVSEANEGIRLRDEFLSIVSHELKTPLTGLQLQLDLLTESLGNADARVVEKLRRASISSERLTHLVESLLDVSRIATGRFVLSFEPLDIVRLVDETIDSFRSAAAKSGTTIHLTDEGPILGSWDRVRLVQVLTNLLSNAVKYGVGKPIDVRVESDGDEVLILIRDRGPGIALEDRERIFGRFERASSSRHYGGLGIGLYVVREIVTAHGGTVLASNAPDGGACLTVCLPRDPISGPEGAGLIR